MIVPKQQASAKSDDPAFGFLWVLEDPVAGLLGGYLLVNHRGRPLEFHCTAPMSATRAEEILYGPTLRPHLYCERIGAALLAKATINPQLVMVNQLDCWRLADETSLPVVLVDPSSNAVEAGESQFRVGGERAAQACLDQIEPERRAEVRQHLEELVRYVDLAEPFQRIAEAIREAMGIGETDGRLDAQHSSPSASEASHDQAA